MAGLAKEKNEVRCNNLRAVPFAPLAFATQRAQDEHTFFRQTPPVANFWNLMEANRDIALADFAAGLQLFFIAGPCL
jgi:hypothetical protein